MPCLEDRKRQGKDDTRSSARTSGEPQEAPGFAHVGVILERLYRFEQTELCVYSKVMTARAVPGQLACEVVVAFDG